MIKDDNLFKSKYDRLYFCGMGSFENLALRPSDDPEVYINPDSQTFYSFSADLTIQDILTAMEAAGMTEADKSVYWVMIHPLNKQESRDLNNAWSSLVADTYRSLSPSNPDDLCDKDLEEDYELLYEITCAKPMQV